MTKAKQSIVSGSVAMRSLVSYGPSARGIVSCVLQGVRDSLRLDATPVFFLSSVTVRVRTAQCLLLNGLIFLGSILLADYVWAPLLRKILELSGASGSDSMDDAASSMPLASASIPLPSESSLAGWLHVLFLYAYQLLWIYPLYIISFILNTVWYQDIADHAFITHGGAGATAAAKVGFTFQKWVATMSDEVYRCLLVTAFMVQVTLVSFIPVIGSTLVFVHLCWLYSLYSFEYKWSLLGWSLEYRLKYFEKHWAYFLGFGLPSVTLSLVFPKFISLGIFALAFPLFIILAICARPTSHVPRTRKSSAVTGAGAGGRDVPVLSDPPVRMAAGGPLVPPPAQPTAPVLLPQLPIFRGATWINWCLLQRLQSRTNKRPATKPTAAGAPAAAAVQHR